MAMSAMGSCTRLSRFVSSSVGASLLAMASALSMISSPMILASSSVSSSISCAMRSKSLEAYQEPLSARNVSLSLMIIAVFLYVCRNSFGWCDFVFFHNYFAVEAHLDVFVWPVDRDGVIDGLEDHALGDVDIR